MLDAWFPAADAALLARAQSDSIATCLAAAANGAAKGAEATTQMQSNRGRSKKLGARSIGHKDPGAASAAILLAAWAEAAADL